MYSEHVDDVIVGALTLGVKDFLFLTLPEVCFETSITSSGLRKTQKSIKYVTPNCRVF